MAGSLSDNTTSLTRLAIGGLNSNATGFGSLDLATFGAALSMKTFASASGMTTNQVRLVMQASGLSIMFSSGATVYTLGASAVSAVQP